MNDKEPYSRIYSGGTLNVHDAAVNRLKLLFDNFDRIYVSFSGGKDSGILLNLCIDYMRKNNVTKKLGVMVMDNECNFHESLKFMRRLIDSNLDILEPYWVCIPLTLPCTVSSFQSDWQTWGEAEKDLWVHERPDMEYVVNYDNHQFDFYKENMLDKDFYDGFSTWYSQGKSCANLIGIRTQESLNRFRTIMNSRKDTYNGEMWTRKNGDYSYNCYPIYDWKTDDVWTANALYDWDYNKLYDIFYRSGMAVGTMRVASPFMSESKASLNMYRVIDPDIWSRLCARVNGANFAATYGKQLNYNNIKLPEGHTWKSFVKFLLDTLPEETAINFKQRFAQSIKFWARTGRGLSDEIISELDAHNVDYQINGTTPHGGNSLRRVKIRNPPDHLDFLKSNKGDVTSWKRFAITILKNDHTCKYMGLAPTKSQAERQRAIQEKYSNV